MTSSPWELRDDKVIGSLEVEKILSRARQISSRVHLMVSLSYHAALRVSDLVHIKVSDFNWETRRLLITPAKRRSDQQKPVAYPIPQPIMDEVYGYVMENRMARAAFLFPGRTTRCTLISRPCEGGHISKREVQNIFDRICQELNIKRQGRGIHALKHARLAEVAERTQDPHMVKEIARHASVGMSSKYVSFVVDRNHRS